MNFIVSKNAVGKESEKEQCFYCGQKVGTPHKEDCSLINKKVKVRLTIEYDIDVPNHWTKEDVEFKRNESSWCANNIVEELKELEKNIEPDCFCFISNFEYLSDESEPFLKE